MRWALAILVILGLVFLALQSPQVTDLFKPIPESDEDPLAFLDKPVEKQAPDTRPSRRAARPPAEKVSPPPTPQVPSGTLARVLTGVLGARQLADGVHLSVSDRTITLSGEVDSAEKKKAILEIVKKGSGRRTIDARELKVAP